MTPVSAETDLTDDAGRRGARRLPLLGILLAGVLVLSACGGSPEDGAQTGPNRSPEAASTSPSVSGQSNRGAADESPDATAGNGEESDEAGGEYVPASSDGPAKNVPMPERPPEMSRESADGAEAAVEYWWELYAYSRVSNDMGAFGAMSLDECSKCAKERARVQDVYDQGAWVVNAEYTTELVDMSLAGEGRATGISVVSSEPFTVFEDDGTEHTSEGMDGSQFTFELSFVDGEWRVADWTTTPVRGNESEGS